MVLVKLKRAHARCSLVAVFSAVATFAAPTGLACGYEDPQSIAMGMLNFAYPDALHVGTAVWQAEAEGLLACDPPAPQSTAPLTFAAPLTGNAGPTSPVLSAALIDALRMLEQLRARLSGAPERTDNPSLALVFASKMLWTRFVPSGSAVVATPHASGPEPGDVVLISEPTVLRALLSGSLTTDVAFCLGLIRSYGEPAATERARKWLQRLDTPAT